MFVSEIKVSKVELAQDIYELADPAKLVQSLPETRTLPSAKGFAEYNFSDTRQTIYLPSAIEKTIGKKRHSANKASPVVNPLCVPLKLQKNRTISALNNTGVCL